jgi:hypothetical protein
MVLLVLSIVQVFLYSEDPRVGLLQAPLMELVSIVAGLFLNI